MAMNWNLECVRYQKKEPAYFNPKAYTDRMTNTQQPQQLLRTRHSRREHDNTLSSESARIANSVCRIDTKQPTQENGNAEIIMPCATYIFICYTSLKQHYCFCELRIVNAVDMTNKTNNK